MAIFGVGARRARRRWEAGLAWRRLRYRQPAGLERALTLLSRPAAAGRIALSFQPGAVGRLLVGLPEGQLPLLARMAGDFGFGLAPAEAPGGHVRPLAPAGGLLWERGFTAQLVAGRLFVDVGEGEAERRGSFMPRPAAEAPTEWTLPAPPLGLALDPVWPAAPVPDSLLGETGWPLGCGPDGRPLRAAGAVNVYGRPEAAAVWLTGRLTELIGAEPAGLVVVDGSGILAPRLKRQAAVAHRLGSGVAYLDLDGPPLAGGFNPLAPVPGESDAARLTRWQAWARGLGARPDVDELLADAASAGVGDLPALRRWLARPGLGGARSPAASLRLALERLAARRGLREWLEWPSPSFDVLGEGALLLTCRAAGGWPALQLLRAALLAAGALPGTRLVMVGLPWRELAPLPAVREVVVVDGPLLPGATVVLTTPAPEQAAVLGARFLGGEPQLVENLALLRWGEAVVVQWRAIGVRGDNRAGLYFVSPSI